MNFTHIRGDEYIQQYEDINTNLHTNCKHNVYIYSIIILNVIISIYCLCNIKLNIVQLVAVFICALHSRTKRKISDEYFLFTQRQTFKPKHSVERK
jgi:hypothetical protein